MLRAMGQGYRKGANVMTGSSGWMIPYLTLSHELKSNIMSLQRDTPIRPYGIRWRTLRKIYTIRR
jgi:hypothetical protein